MKRALVALMLGLGIVSMLPMSSAARTLKVIYSFCATAGCPDGSKPEAGLLRDSAGNFYGTALSGGANGKGVVYKLTRDKSTGQYTQTVLYDFCATSIPIDCTDGAAPFSTLVRDKAGNLYGTTAIGGQVCVSHGLSGCGTVFALMRNTSGGYDYQVLHRFCDGSECGSPYSGLTIDADGTLYGTADGGGTNDEYGYVFRLKPNSTKTKWTFKRLYDFGSGWGGLYASLVKDRDGNLYGVTYDCCGDGVVFALMRKPNGGYTFQVPYRFCTKADCKDGIGPSSALIVDKDGNLFGTTEGGGKHGDGTAFRLKPNAGKTKWKHKVLYNFCSRANCTDGDDPYTNLVMDGGGTLFGMTLAGGRNDKGVLFQLTPNKANTAWKQHVLYHFCSSANCADGAKPLGGSGGLIADKSGNLFGTTSEGGAYGFGAVVELVND